MGSVRSRRVAAAACSTLLLLSSCSAHRARHAKPAPVRLSNPKLVGVAGHLISAAGIGDVAAAIRVAGIAIPDGRLLSIVTRKVLRAHAYPATILLNGQRADALGTVHGGDVITFIPGHDAVESTKTIRTSVALDPRAARLYTSTKPGVAFTVKGVISGEQVSTGLSTAPAVGKLRFPARAALTFDDGPNGAYTSKMLSLLVAHHVRAVFCDVGSRALVQSDLVRQQVADGHRLCDHTQTHPLNLPSFSRPMIAAQINDGFRSIVTASGVAPLYFRAPGGNWSQTIERDARADHLRLLRWTVDPRDWSLPGTQVIVQRILDQLRPGGIILMHDGGGDRSQSVAALAQLLDELLTSGWTFVFPD